MSGRKTYVNNAQNRRLGRVGMAHGSAVASRSGGSTFGAMSCSSSYSSSSGASRSGSRTYVDNSSNRSLGRVGMPHGSAVASRSSGSTFGGGASCSDSGTYVDNSSNRSLGRVGMPHGSAVASRSSSSTFGAMSCSSSYSSSSGASHSGSGTYVDNSSNRSLGRVGMPHGSAVASRSSGSTFGAMSCSSSYSSSSGASRSGSGVYVDNPSNRKLGHVGLEYGTAVEYGMAVESKSSSNPSVASSTVTKTYVDNHQNRKLGRVGEEHSTHVASGSSTSSTASCSSKPAATNDPKDSTYIDNAYNRRLGRVGKPKGAHVVHNDGRISINGKDTYVLGKAFQRKQKIADAIENSYEDPLIKFEHLNIDDSTFCGIEEDTTTSHAARIVRLEEIEENWKKREIIPQTDTSKIKAAANCISRNDLEDLRLIGRGGFGAVYAALWKPTKTPVAYKRLASQSFTQKKLQGFVKEIEIFAKLEHKNIVKMFGAVTEKEDIGIVMEYCKKTLFDALFVYEEDNFTPSDKLRIIGEVGSALEYLHTHEPPIVHCDVKSQNILLDCNVTVKICDFGLSVIKSTIHSSRSTTGEGDAPPGQGTPRYSAPEVLRGETLKLEDLMVADIYSLSLVLYEVALEEEPYEDLSPKQLTKNVGYGDLRPSLESIRNSDLKVLLQQCWSKIPQERPGIKQFNEQWTTSLMLEINI